MTQAPAPDLTIGELAARSGLATSALRFYEERGIIRAERSPSGHRRFPRSTLRRIGYVILAQRVGLTLDEIRSSLASLPADRAPDRSDWARLTAAWHARVDARIAELERLRGSLTECIGCGCLSLDRCSLANPEDRVGRRGSGPRLARTW